MLDRLLESKARQNRSPVGGATSLAAHIAVIIFAVHATAHSRPRPANEPRAVVLPFVRTSSATESPRTADDGPRGAIRRLPQPSIRLSIDPPLPSINLALPSATDPGDFRRDATANLGVTGTVVAGTSGTFRADQVERQVVVLAGAPLPEYPEALRIAGIEGEVVAEFAVNELGRIEADSVRIVRSSNVLFDRSVRNVLRRMRFAPAEIGGRKVRQLVRMPFLFTLSGR